MSGVIVVGVGGEGVIVYVDVIDEMVSSLVVIVVIVGIGIFFVSPPSTRLFSFFLSPVQ